MRIFLPLSVVFAIVGCALSARAQLDLKGALKALNAPHGAVITTSTLNNDGVRYFLLNNPSLDFEGFLAAFKAANTSGKIRLIAVHYRSQPGAFQEDVCASFVREEGPEVKYLADQARLRLMDFWMYYGYDDASKRWKKNILLIPNLGQGRPRWKIELTKDQKARLDAFLERPDGILRTAEERKKRATIVLAWLKSLPESPYMQWIVSREWDIRAELTQGIKEYLNSSKDVPIGKAARLLASCNDADAARKFFRDNLVAGVNAGEAVPFMAILNRYGGVEEIKAIDQNFASLARAQMYVRISRNLRARELERAKELNK